MLNKCYRVRVKSCPLESCCLKLIIRNSVLEGLRVRMVVDIQEEICCKVVWGWVMLESKLQGVNKKQKSSI